jgi:hypothetical protein
MVFVIRRFGAGYKFFRYNSVGKLQQYKIEIGSMESCNYLLFLVQVKRQKLVHVWIKTSSTF